MKGQQSPQWLLCLLMASCLASAQEATPTLVDVPDAVDPNEGSGWLRIELAVLVDDRAEIIASEAWPPYPATQYPNRHRRLQDGPLLKELAAQYPETQVTSEPDGSITLVIPDPQQIVAKAKADALAAQQQALILAMNPDANDNDTNEGIDDLTTDASADLRTAAPTENSEPIALELIDGPQKPANAGADWLSDFDEASPQAETGDTKPLPVDVLDASTIDAAQAPAPPPVLPKSFQVRPVELLADGLQRLTRSNPDQLQLSTSWLQAPEVANLPIILDNSGDDPDWPQLQGFVEIRTGDTLKIGVNFWWNTDAAYLPEGFYMTSPPMAPAQRLWRDEASLLPLPLPVVAKRQATFKAIEEHLDAGLPLVEFVDPTTGFFREITAEPDTTNNFSPNETWPWRHFIHVADTRSVAEGYVRYFDHPLLKIITTWRELTWGEIYQIGAADREREELELAIEDAQTDTTEPTAPPLSRVPPDKQTLR